MNKYFPLPRIYMHSPYETTAFNDIYSALRTILKDPIRDQDSNTYSLQKQHTDPIKWNVYAAGSKFILQVSLPYDGSAHVAALMVKMGTHTLEETWEEHKDLWYEDLAAQVAHLEKGAGP